MPNFLALLAPIIFGAAVAAAQSASSSTVVCVAGQCLQGFTNTTIGATLSAKDASTSVLLLPGTYTSTTNPALLHSLLTASSASLSPATGFNVSNSVSLPLNVALSSGLAVYPSANYSGSASFSGLPSAPAGNSSSSTPLSAGSLALASNIWVAVSTSSSSSDRVILWDSIPDVAQLPAGSGSSLSLLDLQSSSCSPPCSGNGVCSASGTCTCPTGFTGSSCESCADGFFGSECQACPAGCTDCDDGMSGTGRCLSVTVSNPPSSCNCLNGECQSDGSCTCIAGWTTATNGTACGKCASGFFLTDAGDCEVCALGCTDCADSSGTCITCSSGFTQNANDRTQCVATAASTSTGTVCPDGSFSNGTACQPCAATCQTCNGPTSNDCIICGTGNYKLNGSCVSTDSNGVCEGTTGMVADNNKHECNTCPAKCTGCKIPNFTVASTIDQAQCTGCLPGFVLSNGKCVESCPSATFLSPTDNLTCTACDSSCSTCAGSSTFCLTCANNQLASEGSCVASCPSNTFSSSGKCIPCHPDCATCSGAGFNQCSSCPSNRPVLTNGRCLPTCSKNQFFDKTSSTCQSCDSSCSSCSGSGPSNCLACSSSSQVLRGGTCASASCSGNSTVVPGLGICLSDLVMVPVVTASGTTSAVPLPTITGINTPITTKSSLRPLAWWEILLMALGCAFIFVVILMLWRRRARQKRAQQTAQFATARGIKPPSWRRRMLWRLFGRGQQPIQLTVTAPDDAEAIKLMKIRNAEEARHHHEMEKLQLYGAYEYSTRSSPSRAPSALPSLHDDRHFDHRRDSSWSGSGQGLNRLSSSDGSIYSQITGMPRKGPEPRQPVKDRDGAGRLMPPTSRFSMSTKSSNGRPPSETQDTVAVAPLIDLDQEDRRSSAERYATDMRAQKHLVSANTGGSSSSLGSRNPFRR
ncbi:hypothetical protein PUNSTDRAFT_144417 [Punctularia strigosozonata HHB-11173 SS5]|uniref:uncharacterized protein n=1 Tax=Punctularia strigosozonata (strain HHB-11173) TaxID=741275 RepID=UPI00044175F3|nr:uncharacterized protein PUNSTDRAFT_144417 [Punctularia strigosozonata HHB-11173 SS5]EIN07935.1 hypothetical protein PUNSTDRAFT_144417 [Punctularia strigosozonata HHB-11173 SS5]